MVAETEKFYPDKGNLGKDCGFWDILNGYKFPRAEIKHRTSCEGIIDSVCLYLKDGIPDPNLTPQQRMALKIIPPGKNRRFIIPPGTTS